ncbi:MAG TPA: hypothetical protein VGJ15_06725, partial [Pirellulales bacterium]
MSKCFSLTIVLLATAALALRAGWASEPSTNPPITQAEAKPKPHADLGTAQQSPGPSEAAPGGATAVRNPNVNSSVQLVVLRNGEFFSGAVTRQADRYVIVRDGSEIRLPAREVDFVCQSVDEAYSTLRRRVVAGRIDDRLNLADWCLRHNLLGDAAQEIAEAMTIDSHN